MSSTRSGGFFGKYKAKRQEDSATAGNTYAELSAALNAALPSADGWVESDEEDMVTTGRSNRLQALDMKDSDDDESDEEETLAQQKPTSGLPAGARVSVTENTSQPISLNTKSKVMFPSVGAAVGKPQAPAAKPPAGYTGANNQFGAIAEDTPAPAAKTAKAPGNPWGVKKVAGKKKPSMAELLKEEAAAPAPAPPKATPRAVSAVRPTMAKAAAKVEPEDGSAGLSEANIAAKKEQLTLGEGAELSAAEVTKAVQSVKEAFLGGEEPAALATRVGKMHTTPSSRGLVVGAVLSSAGEWNPSQSKLAGTFLRKLLEEKALSRTTMSQALGEAFSSGVIESSMDTSLLVPALKPLALRGVLDGCALPSDLAVSLGVKAAAPAVKPAAVGSTPARAAAAAAPAPAATSISEANIAAKKEQLTLGEGAELGAAEVTKAVQSVKEAFLGGEEPAALATRVGKMHTTPSSRGLVVGAVLSSAGEWNPSQSKLAGVFLRKLLEEKALSRGVMSQVLGEAFSSGVIESSMDTSLLVPALKPLALRGVLDGCALPSDLAVSLGVKAAAPAVKPAAATPAAAAPVQDADGGLDDLYQVVKKKKKGGKKKAPAGGL